MEYVIVGDREYKGSLLFVCGKDKDFAEETLNRLLTNPDNNDKNRIEGFSNLRVKEVADENCWWNDPFLAN